jgi:radical SAM superfamily enzyme YgiQ (UPF0313 family)
MGKPGIEVFERFRSEYEKANAKFEKKQFLVPYFMSSHPGCTLRAAIMLAEYMHNTHLHPEQVQDFYPTPGTMSTCMFYTELDPRNGKRVYVAKKPEEKAMQRALMQYNRPENHDLVMKALTIAGRYDLIGRSEHCLTRDNNETRKPNSFRKNEKQRDARGGKRDVLPDKVPKHRK